MFFTVKLQMTSNRIFNVRISERLCLVLQVMFAQGLLQLVNDKLSVDIEEIVYTDEWFSHTVDEVINPLLFLCSVYFLLLLSVE